jgi:hypothetical protein
MSRVTSLLVSACFLGSISFLALTPAFAVSPSEESCVSPCTFSRDGGVVSCNCPRGNDEHSATVKDESNGTFNNEPKHTCKGPGQSTAGC